MLWSFGVFRYIYTQQNRTREWESEPCLYGLCAFKMWQNRVFWQWFCLCEQPKIPLNLSIVNKVSVNFIHTVRDIVHNSSQNDSIIDFWYRVKKERKKTTRKKIKRTINILIQKQWISVLIRLICFSGGISISLNSVSFITNIKVIKFAVFYYCVIFNEMKSFT